MKKLIKGENIDWGSQKIKNKSLIFCFYLLSLFLVSYSQSSRYSFFFLSFSCSYALLWWALSFIKVRSQYFLSVFLWIFTIKLIQFEWLATPMYIGPLAYIAWITAALFISIEFSLFSLLLDFFFRNYRLITVVACIPALWFFLEWSRQYILFSGFLWDNLGLGLSEYLYESLSLSLLGINGVSFLVVLTNICALYLVKKPSLRLSYFWITLSLFPLMYGYIHFHCYSKKIDGNAQKFLKASLVQSFFSPFRQEEKTVKESFMERWETFLDLSNKNQEKVDIIVFPETIIPCGTELICTVKEMQEMFSSKLECSFSKNLNPEDLVSGLFFLQKLSEIKKAYCLMGVETFFICPQTGEKNVYNSAILSSPHKELILYNKEELVSFGEEIPKGYRGEYLLLGFLSQMVARSISFPGFSRGKSDRIIFTKHLPPFGMTICCEELYSGRIKNYRNQNADFLISIGEDGWYPSTSLPFLHLMHAKMRCIEMGLPMIRSYNNGISCVIDSLGRVRSSSNCKNFFEETCPKISNVKIIRYKYRTLYSLWGDAPFLCLFFSAFIFFSCIFISSLREDNLPKRK